MAAEENSSNKNEQTNTAVPSVESEIDNRIRKTVLSLLNTIQESMTSSNTLLRELRQRKDKAKSSSHSNSAAKQKKPDPNESSQAVKSAAEKAKGLPHIALLTLLEVCCPPPYSWTPTYLYHLANCYSLSVL